MSDQAAHGLHDRREVVRGAIDDAEAAKFRARLRLANAEYHAETVANSFGLMSPEYAVAAAVVSHEQGALIAACDVLVGMYSTRRAA